MAIRNVTSYGAVGDGSTDDTTAVQAAAAALVSGDSLYFPGTSVYLIDYFVIAVSNVVIEGDSAGSRAEIRKRTASSTNTPMISALDKNSITVRNLILNGQGTSQTWWEPDPYVADPYTVDAFDVYANNVELKGGAGHVITDVYSHHAGSAGIRIYGCAGVTVTRLVGNNNGFGTLAVYARTYLGSPRSSDVSVVDSIADLDYCDGFRFVEVDNVSVIGCSGTNIRFIPTAPAQFAGIYIDTVIGCVIRDCTFSGSSARGIDSSPSSTDCVIFNNRVFDHPQDGILPGLSGFVIQKNRIYNNGVTGIAAKGGSHFFKDNVCHGHVYGIGTTGNTPNITLVNNDCRGNSSGSVSPDLRGCTGFSETGTIEDTDNFAGVYPANGAALAVFL